MLIVTLLILTTLCYTFAEIPANVDRNEWDILMLLEQKYKLGIENGDTDFMLNITDTSKDFKVPAQTIFPNRKMNDKLFIYIHFQPKVKSFTLMSIRDPDNRIRFQFRGYERRGQFNEFRVVISMDPLVTNDQNYANKVVEFTVPFLFSPWTIGILIEYQKMTFFTGCDDIVKPFGYHHIINTAPLDGEMFKAGATIYFFGDGSSAGQQDKFIGTVSEFIITNQTRVKELMCREETIEGSGNKMKSWKPKFLGNIVLTTNVSTTLSTTKTPSTTVQRITTSTSDQRTSTFSKRSAKISSKSKTFKTRSNRKSTTSNQRIATKDSAANHTTAASKINPITAINSTAITFLTNINTTALPTSPTTDASTITSITAASLSNPKTNDSATNVSANTSTSTNAELNPESTRMHTSRVFITNSTATSFIINTSNTSSIALTINPNTTASITNPTTTLSSTKSTTTSSQTNNSTTSPTINPTKISSLTNSTTNLSSSDSTIISSRTNNSTPSSTINHTKTSSLTNSTKKLSSSDSTIISSQANHSTTSSTINPTATSSLSNPTTKLSSSDSTTTSSLRNHSTKDSTINSAAITITSTVASTINLTLTEFTNNQTITVSSIHDTSVISKENPRNISSANNINKISSVSRTNSHLNTAADINSSKTSTSISQLSPTFSHLFNTTEASNISSLSSFKSLQSTTYSSNITPKTTLPNETETVNSSLIIETIKVLKSSGAPSESHSKPSSKAHSPYGKFSTTDPVKPVNKTIMSQTNTTKSSSRAYNQQMSLNTSSTSSSLSSPSSSTTETISDTSKYSSSNKDNKASFSIINFQTSTKTKTPECFTKYPVDSSTTVMESMILKDQMMTNKKGEKGDLGERGFPGYNGSDCDCLKLMRLNKLEKGEKGIKGSRGYKGSKGQTGPVGPSGTCSEALCSPITEIKGLKGDMGAPGYCSENMCQQMLQFSIGTKGDKGSLGASGPKGDKGNNGDATNIVSSLIPEIRNSVEDFMTKNINAWKGDPGSCSCPTNDPKKDDKRTSTQTIVLNDLSELKPLASLMPIGKLAFLITENVLLMKIDDVKNRWRSVKLDDMQNDWYITEDIGNSMQSQQNGQFMNTVPPVLDTKITFDTSFKLMVIALPRPTAGDLRSVVYEPGAYSGSSYQCQKQAYNYGLGRAFYPLINTDTFDFTYMVPEKYRYAVPVVNRKNERIANNFEEFSKLNAAISSPILDFEGNSIMSSTSPPCVWIGRKPTLYENKFPAEEGLCLNWMTRRRNTTGTITRLVLHRPLLDVTHVEETACDNVCYVLCMQIYPLISEVDRRV